MYYYVLQVADIARVLVVVYIFVEHVDSFIERVDARDEAERCVIEEGVFAQCVVEVHLISLEECVLIDGTIFQQLYYEGLKLAVQRAKTIIELYGKFN